MPVNSSGVDYLGYTFPGLVITEKQVTVHSQSVKCLQPAFELSV